VFIFQTKNPDLGKFWRAYGLRPFWKVLWTLGIFYDHLVHFVFV
jgi:hypothetical protein